MIKKILLVLLVALCFPFLIFAETVVLKSGKTVEGKITEKTDKSITIDFQGVELTYDNAEIERIIDHGKIVFIPAATVNVGEKIKLRLNVKKGDTYQVRSVAEQKIFQGRSFSVMQGTNQSIGMGLEMKVEDVDASGNALIRCTYNWMQTKMSTPMGEVEYDSANPNAGLSAQSSPVTKIFAVLLGKSLMARVTPIGVTVEVSGVDAMLMQMVDELKLPYGSSKAQLKKQLRAAYSEQTLKDSLKNVISPYPEQAVAVGDSWTRKDALYGPFPLISYSRYTLKERKNGLAIIEVNSNLKSPEPIGESVGLGYELKGEQQGIMWLSEETGIPMKTKMIQKIRGQKKEPPTLEMPQGIISRAISIETITTTETTKH